jgi:hypothetical protein
MLIQEKPLQHWINFYGYGSWQASIWFIGYEEGGGDLPEEVSEKLNYFSEHYSKAPQPTLCDIRDLYRHVAFRAEGPRSDLFSSLHEYRFGSNAVLHGYWKNLIAFAHGYRGKKLPGLLEYQKKFFASPSKPNETLIQLYPLPSSHNHAWYYSWLDLPQFSFLKRRTQYEEYVYPDRIKTILDKIRAHKPELVLMYGMDNINTLKKSVEIFYPSAKFRMVKGVKRQLPQHHRTDIDGTMLLITSQIPALRHNRIETGFDWEEFGKSVRAEST